METNGLCLFSSARFYYHIYRYMISHDGQFFTLCRYEITHVTYSKFNTGISNKLASQREHTITFPKYTVQYIRTGVHCHNGNTCII